MKKYNDNFTIEADLILEIADLLNYNKFTHDIMVDKRIFDNFAKNTAIYIRFIDDDNDCIREYVMTSENEDGIFMEYLCEYEN